MYNEDEYIMISALNHYIFCSRRCALIHIHGFWAENKFTAKGKIIHEQVDKIQHEKKREIKIVRGLSLYSRKYGLSGRADVVEFHKNKGSKIPYPIEYKLGKPKLDESDSVQLSAQAICIEEMLNVNIHEGAMFYNKTRRRQVVQIDTVLRKKTIGIIEKVHEMKKNYIVPEAKYEKKCNSCSLYDECLPKFQYAKINKYIKELYRINEEAS